MCNEQLKQRYTDPNLSCDNPSHIVTEAQLGQVKQLLKSAVESSDFDELILRAQSMSKRPLPEPELPMVPEQVPALLTMDNATVVRTPGSRLLKHFDKPHYFANGELFVVTAEAEALAKQLAELNRRRRRRWQSTQFVEVERLRSKLSPIRLTLRPVASPKWAL